MWRIGDAHRGSAVVTNWIHDRFSSTEISVTENSLILRV